MRSMARRSSGTGTGAAAMTTLRRLERSKSPDPGASSKACSIADTTKVKLMRSRSIVRSTCKGSKPRCSTMAAACHQACAAYPMTPTWKAGVVSSTRVSESNSLAQEPPSAVATQRHCERRAPLGRPVVPLV